MTSEPTPMRAPSHRGPVHRAPPSPRLNATAAAALAAEIARLWALALANPHDSLHVAQGTVMKPARRGDAPSLGFRLRMQILRCATGCTPSGFAHRFGAAGAERDHKETLRKLFRTPIRSDYRFSTPKPTRPAIEAMAARALAELAGDNAPRAVEPFLTQPFGGHDAPTRLSDWLAGTPRPSALATGDGLIKAILADPTYQYFADPARGSLPDLVRQHLGGAEARWPVFCIPSKDNIPNGLTALAAELWRTEQRQDVRPWCYIPVARGRPGAGDTSLPAIVARLEAFYRNEDLSGATPCATEAETAAAIARIRAHIAVTPAVLVFDGCNFDGGCRPHLTRYLRDEPVVPLLWRLLQPLRSEEMLVHDPAVFTRTRVIVLGDNDLAPLLPTLCRTSQPLAAPTRQGSVTGTLRKTLVEPELQEAFGQVSPQLLMTETMVWLMRAQAVLARADGASARNTLRALAATTPGRADLCAALVARLRRRGDAAWPALAFCVLSPTELRVKTLYRLLHRWYLLFRPDPLTAPEAAVTLVTSALQGVLVQCHGETIAHLYSDDLEAEYDAATWGTPPPAPGRADALDIADPAVRADLQRAMQATPHARAELAAMHFVLAEMSLQQHGLLVRSAPTGEHASAAFYRRLGQAILHGVLSVHHWPQLAERSHHAPTALPLPLGERLRALYWEHYRAGLEQAPAWAMSRTFGLDTVKAELCQLFLDAITVLGAQRTLADVAREVREHQIRAALRRGDFNSLSAHLQALPGAERDRAPYAKVTADWYTLTEGYGVAIALCGARLKTLGDFGLRAPAPLTEHAVLEDAVAAEVRRLASDDTPLRSVVARPHGRRILAEIVDVIERLACVSAYDADGTAHGDATLAAQRFGTAYYYFRVSQNLPAAVAAAGSPTDPQISAATARVFVRVALKLGRHFERTGDAGSQGDAFYLQARQHADRLWRNVYRHPMEHVQLLIIESSLARIHAHAPWLALKWLARAEATMPSPDSRPRFWIRLLHERIKVLRAIAELQLTGPSLRANIIKAACQDVGRMYDLADQFGTKHLVHLAELQREKLAML
ncbi:MAG: hypothetical protein BGP12_00100 [Rhodospirillales bacterium 70-18]|nr:hypothetical protein [Rhodospirillales bacterium]OJY78295.1 MAG: hypothetical protein BGP12_00100 [Rhodospirillales bacterium 70-18]